MNAPINAHMKQFMTTPDPIIKYQTPPWFLMSQKLHLNKVRARFVHKEQKNNKVTVKGCLRNLWMPLALLKAKTCNKKFQPTHGPNLSSV